MVGIQDVLDPTDINIYRDLAGGLDDRERPARQRQPDRRQERGDQAALGQDAAAGPALRGRHARHQVRPRREPEGHAAAARPTGPRRYPATRGGVEYVIRDAFTRAKAYQKAWQEYEKTKATNEDALPPRRDLQLEPLVEILEGKRLVHAHCYRADEILMLIRLAEEMGFKIATFQHVLEGYKVAKEIAAHGAGASTFSDWWGYKIEAADAIPYNAAIMVRKGVLVSINSDSAEHARRLNTEAAKIDPLGRPDRGRSVRARHDQPGEAAAHRQARRLARSRQGRRRRRLDAPSAQHLRHRRSRLHRRHAVLRPRRARTRA